MTMLLMLFYLLGFMPGLDNPQPTDVFEPFNETVKSEQWTIVNDNVMGGRSKATIEYTKAGTLKYSGEISLQNNGGFSSIRSPKKEYKLAGYKGFIIRLKADGRKYNLILSDTYYFNGVSYFSYFETKANEWMEIRIPFASFEGTILGTPSDRVPQLDANAIKEVGFMLYDKQAGPFQVELDWIKLYE